MNRMRLRGKVVFVGEAKYRRVPGANDMKRAEMKEDDQNISTCWLQREEVQIEARKNTTQLKKKTAIRDPHENGWTKKVEVVVAKENLD
ncbi:hypothetical protein AHAS_Ahas16G0127100 [Arachis hypogaea]